MKRLLAVVVLMAPPLLLLAQAAPSAGNLQTPANPVRARSDEVLYGRFFAQVVAISKQADEADRLGMNSRYLRTYFQVKAQLNPNEVTLLNQVTADLAAQIAQYDTKAKELRDQFHILVERARAANAPIPPVPAEILSLSPGRRALILQARDRLRLNFGDSEFRRLDTYVRAHAPGAQKPSTASQSPKATIPDRVLYKSFFQLVAHFKARAEEERRLGLPEVADRLLTQVQRQAGLSEEQGRVLDEVTTEYLRQLDSCRTQMQAAQLPYRKLLLDVLARDNKSTGTPELSAARKPVAQIAAQMDDANSEAIQRLRTGLGDEGFARLDAFVKRTFKVTQTAPPPESATLGPFNYPQVELRS